MSSARTERIVSSLGWLGLGLGTAQLVAPEVMARLVGVKPTKSAKRTMRMLGVREALSGIGILTRRGRQPWLLARVAGDVMDAALLGRTLATRSRSPVDRLMRVGGAPPLSRAGVALAGVAAVGAMDFIAHRLLSADESTSRPAKALPPVAPILRASITIDRAAADLYAFWREVENLPRFLSRSITVKATDRTRSHWEIKGPLGQTASWNAVIVEDHPMERLAWQVERGTFGRLIDGGEVSFVPARGRGTTEVHVILRTSGTGPARALNSFLREVPERWIMQELHRFKQLMELGEIPQSDASIHAGKHPARPTEGGSR